MLEGTGLRPRKGCAGDERMGTSCFESKGAADRPMLIGDHIENPANAESLRAVAETFQWTGGFLNEPEAGATPDTRKATADELTARFSPIIAVENGPGAECVYGFRPPPGQRIAVIVGNERKGISRALLARADRMVQIPVVSRSINTVNVAVAAAIALYYLSRGGGGRLRQRPDPERCRPQLLALGPGDAIEFGSLVRSAAAFGWEHLFVEDRFGVWYGADRVTRSLGRGAARRGRNDLRVLPARAHGRPFDRARGRPFEEACVITAAGEGESIHQVDLARGPSQLLVLPDETRVDDAVREAATFARQVRRVRLELPGGDVAYRYRLAASIALAEAARQIGIRAR